MADFDVTISDGTALEVVVSSTSGGGAGVSDHGDLTGLADDDHTQYHTDARGDARYRPLSYVPAWTDVTGKPSVFPPDTHNHDERYFTETESDARYLQSVPGSYATDAEVTSAISAHEAASDPHTGYQKESEKGQASGYASLDGSGLVPDAQIPSAIARDSEVTSAISTHEAASDPHTGYQKESEKDQNSGYAGLNSSGLVPISRIATGAPDGTKFVRDDGVLATPSGGGGTLTKVYAAQGSAVSISASTYTKMTFTTTGEIDSLNEFDPTTGTFTAASTKRVHFNCIVTWASNSTGYRAVRYYKNGSQTRFALTIPPVNGDVTALLLSAYLDLTSGDTVDVRAVNPSTGGSASVNSDAGLTTFEAHGVG